LLKTRIIPILLFKDYGLVKGKIFDSWRRTGSAMQAVKVYNLREVDELIFLDITATLQNRGPDIVQIDELADECFMPMTVGGGIKTIKDISNLLSVGADKVAINTACYQNTSLITESAKEFGAQCIVVSIDIKNTGTNTWKVYSHCGSQCENLDPVAWAKEVEQRGAGEILLTSIDRDGTMEGYDVEITKMIADAISIPVIAAGGAGNYSHMADVLDIGNASAVAASSMYHFTEQTPLEAKSFLADKGFNIRLPYES
jgi:imidazole glycerol-phosphate synthase subunit HisF